MSKEKIMIMISIVIGVAASVMFFIAGIVNGMSLIHFFLSFLTALSTKKSIQKYKETE